MLDQGCSYRMMCAGICWALATIAGVVGWLLGVEMLPELGLALVCIASMLTIINDNARTRRVVRLSLAHQSEPAAAVRSLR